MMVVVIPEDRRVIIKVDPAHPEAWQSEPFYREIKTISARVPDGFQVGVQVGSNITLIRPDRDIDLGPVAAI